MARSLIVEADGGSRGNPGPAGYGAVVRDAVTGAVLVETAEFIGHASNNVAEYRGAISGLQHAHRIDPTAEVEVRLDSKLVVEQMSGRWQIKHAGMRDLARQARAVFAPGQVTYTWVPRADNHRADRLANEVLDQVTAGGAPLILRTDGLLAEDVVSQDVVGSIAVEGRAADRPRPNVMVGWADLGQPTVTVLARHGATAWSLEKRFSGLGGFDAPLAPVGEQQARALADEVRARHDVTRIVASPLLRTRQTAQFVAEAVGLPVEVDDGLAECAFGAWDGLTFREVSEQYPDDLQAWLGSVDVAPPGGESFAQVRLRVTEALARIEAASPAQRLLVVSHVSPIKILVGHALGAPLASVYRMELQPCSVTTLAWFPDGNASMFSFGEAGHLHAVPVPPGT